MTLLRRRPRHADVDPLLEQLSGAVGELRAATVDLVTATDSVRAVAQELAERGDLGDRRGDAADNGERRRAGDA